MPRLAPLRPGFFRPGRPCATCPRSERLKGLGPQFWLRATNHPSTAYLFSFGPAGSEFRFYVRAMMNICVECPPFLAQRFRQPHFAPASCTLPRAPCLVHLASCASPRASCCHGFEPDRGHGCVAADGPADCRVHHGPDRARLADVGYDPGFCVGEVLPIAK